MAQATMANNADAATLRTLDKGLLILEELALLGRAGANAAELGRRLGLHRTTVHRFLGTLVLRGYAEQIEGSDHYRLGIKALALAAASLAGLPLRDIGAPVLEELNRLTHETVHSVVLDEGDVVTVDRLEAEHPISLRTQIGARRPAYCSATGKAMLAFLPEPMVDAILARGMERRTARTITDPRAYKQELLAVRQRGYGLDDEEFTEGIRCVASPVFDLTGRVIGAISLSAPTMRVDLDRLETMALAVVEAAHRLSRQLGYRASPRGGHHDVAPPP
jgi:IclR family transcriptional regulator, KDG regulon repressor